MTFSRGLGFAKLGIFFGAPRTSAASLRDVLETGPIPEKYFLSPRACGGVLNRAERRGRKLPPLLRDALSSVAGSGSPETEETE